MKILLVSGNFIPENLESIKCYRSGINGYKVLYFVYNKKN